MISQAQNKHLDISCLMAQASGVRVAKWKGETFKYNGLQLLWYLINRYKKQSPQNSHLNKIQVGVVLLVAMMAALQGYQGCYSPHTYPLVQTSCWGARHHNWSSRCKREEEGKELHVFSLSRHPLGSCIQFCWNFIGQNLVMRLQLTTKRVQFL